MFAINCAGFFFSNFLERGFPSRMENFVYKVYIYSFCLLINFVTNCDKYSGKNIVKNWKIRWDFITKPFPLFHRRIMLRIKITGRWSEFNFNLTSEIRFFIQLIRVHEGFDSEKIRKSFCNNYLCIIDRLFYLIYLLTSKLNWNFN